MLEYIAILILVLLIWIIILKNITKENFGTYNSNYKQYCASGENLDSYACDRCYNYGRCGNIYGQQFCTPGDSNGPYYRNDCVHWTYSSPDIYYPQTHRFPMIMDNSLYPYSKTYPMKSINK